MDDTPRVGDDRRIHAMNVMRGDDDQGVPGMRCSSCHQPANQPLALVPGAPHWHLAPRAMGWQGLDDRALAQALQDPAKNGGRSLEQVVDHMAHDALVLWGWDPGPGREPIPVPHEAFIRDLRRWVDAGAPLPEAGITSTF
jgi:hypothetical protein